MMKLPKSKSDLLQIPSNYNSFELQKRLTFLAIGTLALYFVVLNGKNDPVLTNLQKVTLALGVTTMAVAAMCGILGWHAFARRHDVFFDASGNERDLSGQDFIALFKYWYFRQSIYEMWLKYLFGMGLIFSIAFMLTSIFRL